MAPKYHTPVANPDAPPRVGGYVTYRKKGGRVTRGLIKWIHLDGSMRVQPTIGRKTIIDNDDIARAAA